MMNEQLFKQALLTLKATKEKKHWLTANTIAKKINNGTSAKQIEQALLDHCTTSKNPLVRYSSLPSRISLEVLWGEIAKVGHHYVQPLTKSDIADDNLDHFVELAEWNVFFSHSHRDYIEVMEVAELLLAENHQDKVIPWLAETHIGQGEHIHDEIIYSLNESQAFLLFLSPHALDSRWTGKEYMNALKHNKPIFIVANIDHPVIKTILTKIHSDSPMLEHELLGTAPQASEFIRNILVDNGSIMRIFAYSDKAISASTMKDFPCVRPLTELAAAIREYQHKG